MATFGSLMLNVAFLYNKPWAALIAQQPLP